VPAMGLIDAAVLALLVTQPPQRAVAHSYAHVRGDHRGRTSRLVRLTQPPDTEPTTSPLGPTTIEAPGSRGDEPLIATTVPIPTVAPASHQQASSRITSRTRHSAQDRLVHLECPGCRFTSWTRRV
jgi:hypothetical protein